MRLDRIEMTERIFAQGLFVILNLKNVGTPELFWVFWELQTIFFNLSNSTIHEYGVLIIMIL